MKKVWLLSVAVGILYISALAQSTKEQKLAQSNKEQQNKDVNSDNITTTASTIEAQEQDKIKELQKEQAEWEKKVIEQLKLKKSQKEDLDSINNEFKENIDNLKLAKERTKEEADKKMIASKMEDLKKERESAFMKLLTPVQLAKYKELVEKRDTESQTQTLRKPIQGAATRVEQ